MSVLVYMTISFRIVNPYLLETKLDQLKDNACAQLCFYVFSLTDSTHLQIYFFIVVFGVLHFEYNVHRCAFLVVIYPAWYLFSSLLAVKFAVCHYFRKVFSHYYFEYLFCSIISLFSFWFTVLHTIPFYIVPRFLVVICYLLSFLPCISI